MRPRKMNKDLTGIEGTIGKLFLDNYDKLMAVKSSAQAYGLVKGLFENAAINTPKSRQILFKLQSGMSQTNTLMYLTNIYLNAKGLGSMAANKWYTCPERNCRRI